MALRESHVSIVLVRALIDVLQRRGVPAEKLLGRGSDALLSEPANGVVPLAHYQSLMARAIALTDDPALGLHCGLDASESSFGLMSPLVSYVPSLRQAIALLSQFHGLLLDDVHIELSECMGTAQLRCTLFAAVDRSLRELIVAGLVRLLRAFGCTSTEIERVCFEHVRPAHHHAYAAAFGGAERFAQSFTGVEFSARALDRPHMHRQPELHALLRAEAERNLARVSRPLTCAERVRALIDSRARQAPDMSVASRTLGVSIRSLRRKLKAEGTSYRELMQAMLQESACALLRNPDLTIQSIAHTLGFADASTFHRAFVRWTGLTPVAYREAPASRRSA